MSKSVKCKVRVKVQSDFGKIFILTSKKKNVQVDQIEVLLIHINEGGERRQRGHQDLRGLNLDLQERDCRG